MAEDVDGVLDALDHATHVRRTIDLAREAGERGDPPYGSLLVRDGAVVAEARNRERTDGDIALHPELSLARRAARGAPALDCRTVLDAWDSYGLLEVIARTVRRTTGDDFQQSV